MSGTSPTGAVELDRTRFPVVVMRFRSAMQDADIEWLMKRSIELFQQPHRYALITLNEGGVLGMNASQAHRLGQFQNEWADEVAAKNVCSAVVIKSRVARGIFAAYHRFAKAASPQLAFGSSEEAERWVTEMLEADGALAATA